MVMVLGVVDAPLEAVTPAPPKPAMSIVTAAAAAMSPLLVRCIVPP